MPFVAVLQSRKRIEPPYAIDAPFEGCDELWFKPTPESGLTSAQADERMWRRPPTPPSRSLRPVLFRGRDTAFGPNEQLPMRERDAARDRSRADTAPRRTAPQRHSAPHGAAGWMVTC